VIDTARVRLGFFESFLGADTLLMDGDAEGMALLAKTLRDFPGSDQSSLALHELEFVDTRAGIRLVASRAARDSGIERDGDMSFVWRCSSAGWEDAADRIAVLSEQSGHQYLDEPRKVRVMASRGEYDDGWWARAEPG
jgi:hypothetical protein